MVVSIVVWSAAMAAMMLPSELPLFRLAHATTRSSGQTGALVAGYAAVWLVVGAAAMSLPELPEAIVLGGAAIYQLTPLKRRCLNVCRSPLSRVILAGRAVAVALAGGAVAWAI